MRYHTLLVRDYGEPWRVEFGSFDLKEVQFERDHVDAAKTKILTAETDDQNYITASVSELNKQPS